MLTMLTQKLANQRLQLMPSRTVRMLNKKLDSVIDMFYKMCPDLNPPKCTNDVDQKVVNDYEEDQRIPIPRVK